MFVFPRKESCTWVAAQLTVARVQALTVRVAAGGQVRLVVDGIDVARDDLVNAAARFDRVAARVTLGAGDHLVAAKVCSGALDDDGRVRLRVTDDQGRWPDGVRASAGPWPKGRPFPKAPSVRPQATPLGRAAGITAGDVDARLDAAILRTLGGADDLRSPRAPGLLASLADAGIDPDRLAMAAWIAPSASNRGAWLNKAREGADARTRAFVDRRLVERHLEAQLSDWAIATLRGARIDADKDGEASLLDARVDLALGTDLLRVAGMRRLKGFMSASPESAPDSVVDYLSQIAEGVDPQLALSARHLLEARGDGGASLVRMLAGAKGRDEAVRAAERAFAQGQVDDADEALAVAQTITGAGAHEEALALYRQLASWAPNRAAVWSGLSHELGVSGVDEDNAALRRARELDPGEARFRAEIALRRRTPTAAGEPSDDERYIVPSQVILARRERQGELGAAAATSYPAGVPDVADRQLHWIRAVVMHRDRRVSEMVQYAREIVIAPRTEDELYEDVPAEGDLTEIVRARVHRRDGTTAFAVEQASEARPRIRWPELSAGDVVEVAFRSWTAGPVGGRGDPPFYRLDYAGALSTHPVLYNEVVVESPDDRPIYVDVVNGKPDRTV